MKVLILAGGFGTRLSEETVLKPKPMVEIGERPILWHIMKTYAHHGFKDFVILLGYKGYMIKEYFANYFVHDNDITINLKENEVTPHNSHKEDWTVTLIDTGANSMTGGRIKRAQPFVGNEPFLLTYGDGVSDVNIRESVEFHKKHGKLMTVTAIQPEGRYGILNIASDETVHGFLEKPKDSWINGGFFVCQPEVFNYIGDDSTVFEQSPLETLAREGNMKAFRHSGFWHAMDTLRDKNKLNSLWETGKAPWKIWND
jgi:glucose-1-phosphate cytidylyltransferase